MRLGRSVVLVLAVGTLAACGGGKESAPVPRAVDDFEARFFAAGTATNPCVQDRQAISGFWLSLEAKRPGVESRFDKGNPIAVDTAGRKYPLTSVIPLNADKADLDRMGTASFCGGSGGVRIEGSEEEWGSVAEMNISFPYANDGVENHVTYTFGAFGTVWLLLFFEAPFDSIEEIHLSNGEVIPRAAWATVP
ncbi:MAG: hypothetical protein QNJ15_15270 [Erythrobacter sp.]|nr:hypothetical protein [Erythrobacter sp.]